MKFNKDFDKEKLEMEQDRIQKEKDLKNYFL
jgi:hypothetical protein